jgi:hypothetical protein
VTSIAITSVDITRRQLPNQVAVQGNDRQSWIWRLNLQWHVARYWPAAGIEHEIATA